MHISVRDGLLKLHLLGTNVTLGSQFHQTCLPFTASISN